MKNLQGLRKLMLETEATATLLVNAKSRRGKEWFSQVKETLNQKGFPLKSAQTFNDPKKLMAAARKAVEDGVSTLIVGGGDGTFSSIARHVAGSKTTLGVLPLGTGNAFARDLGIPADVEQACQIILGGHTAEVDMGIIGDQRFVNVATVGLTTQIALGLQDDSKKPLGRAVYVVSLVRALALVRPFEACLKLSDGREERFPSLLVVIGNGRFHAGPFPITPDASITGGWLAIYALASNRKSDFIKFALRMRGGRQVDLDEVRSYRAHGGRLETTPIKRVTVDGEVCLKTPLDFGVVPGALKVLVPPGFDERT